MQFQIMRSLLTKTILQRFCLGTTLLATLEGNLPAQPKPTESQPIASELRKVQILTDELLDLQSGWASIQPGQDIISFQGQLWRSLALTPEGPEAGEPPSRYKPTDLTQTIALAFERLKHRPWIEELAVQESFLAYAQAVDEILEHRQNLRYQAALDLARRGTLDDAQQQLLQAVSLAARRHPQYKAWLDDEFKQRMDEIAASVDRLHTLHMQGGPTEQTSDPTPVPLPTPKLSEHSSTDSSTVPQETPNEAPAPPTKRLQRPAFLENDALAWTLGLMGLMMVAIVVYRILAEETRPGSRASGVSHQPLRP